MYLYNHYRGDRVKYENYLKSETWQNKRQKRLQIDKCKCALCGSPEKLQVHHIRYPNILGQESVYTDLITLCDDCHKAVHQGITDLYIDTCFPDFSTPATYWTLKVLVNELLSDLRDISFKHGDCSMCAYFNGDTPLHEKYGGCLDCDPEHENLWLWRGFEKI